MAIRQISTDGKRGLYIIDIDGIGDIVSCVPLKKNNKKKK